MHREISHADRAFGAESRLSLYFLTWLIGLIVLADLWPLAVQMLGSWGTGLPIWSNEIFGYRLALIAALIGGARVVYGSLDGLLQGRWGADIALAIAFVAAILLREPLVAAEVIFIGLLGECLEDWTFNRTKSAVRKLAELTPTRCWRLRDGAEERVLVADLAVDDVVVVKPGAKVPADGVVIAGSSAVDVSALTGESLPVDKTIGDELLAGSLNGNGTLTFRVQRVAEHTIVGQVIQLTGRALQDKSPLERNVDQMARYFLPAVLGVALATFLVVLAFAFFGTPRGTLWAAVRVASYPALSVLVVACPCALVLATPAAVIATLGRLAGTGVLIKGSSALERLAQVETFAFDKTGTLTEGRLELGDLLPLEGITPDDLLRWAASAEAQSEHPLARAVLEAAKGVPLETPTAFQTEPGAGVIATIAGQTVLVGNRRLLTRHDIAIPPEAERHLEHLDATGQTGLLVALDGRMIGMLGARDRVRTESAALIEELRRLGIGHIAMLTGDRAAAARPVAAALHINDVRAELLPADKAEILATLPGKVAMVGDGINDAPALARGHVGLAIGGTGIDVAADAGDVVLLIGPDDARLGRSRNPLRQLPLLLRLSREMVRIIRQNIVVFAFGVNALGVVLTAWLWPLLYPGSLEQSPVAAVVYHQIGSLLVLLNSMRLLWFERGEGMGWWRGLERNLDVRWNVDDWLHEGLHYWRESLAALALLGLALWGWSGCYAIGPDEVGVVRRFGRALPETLQPGLNVRYPWPLEVVDRVQPARIRTVELGFRSGNAESVASGGTSGAWSSTHGSRREADEAVLLTGDGSLLEVQATIQYTIVEPAVFLLDVSRPDDLIRDAAEAVLRELAASRSMAALLTAGRSRFGVEARTQLERRLTEAHPQGLGVRLESFALHDIHPPIEVVQAYHDVTRARQRRDQTVHQAKQYAHTIKRREEADGLEKVRRAEAERHERLQQAQTRKTEFLARLAVRQLSWQDELQLLGALLSGQLDAPGYTAACKARQQARAALTDFRLYWDAITAALEGRPKILIDAEGIPGRRTLWLGAPPTAPALPGTTSRPTARPLPSTPPNPLTEEP
jgi:Cu+-exporting ATPase